MNTQSGSPYRQIRANFDANTILVYQAYRDAIAKPAVNTGRFMPPFSWSRMTWIKPSFLWMMGRSNWCSKKGQENVLGIRVTRHGFDRALSLGCLTMFEPGVHDSEASWRRQFENASVHVQWDPERSLRGKKLQHRSVQVGIGSEVIKEFTDNWVVSIEDMTPLARKIRAACLAGNSSRAKTWLPKEREYRVARDPGCRYGIR